MTKKNLKLEDQDILELARKSISNSHPDGWIGEFCDKEIMIAIKEARKDTARELLNELDKYESVNTGYGNYLVEKGSIYLSPFDRALLHQRYLNGK